MGRNVDYNLQEFYNILTRKSPIRFGHQFLVEFYGEDLNDPNITGAFSLSTSNQNNVTDNITYYVQASKIPEVKVNSAKVNYFAAGFEVPGVISYPDQWTVDILLGQDMLQYNRLQSWQEAMSSYRLSGGGYKVIPKVNAHVHLLDSTMQYSSKTYVMEGVWIEQLGNLEFQYQEGAAEPMKCSCTFAMQYWYEKDVEQDPL